MGPQQQYLVDREAVMRRTAAGFAAARVAAAPTSVAEGDVDGIIASALATVDARLRAVRARQARSSPSAAAPADAAEAGSPGPSSEGPASPSEADSESSSLARSMCAGSELGGGSCAGGPETHPVCCGGADGPRRLSLSGLLSRGGARRASAASAASLCLRVRCL